MALQSWLDQYSVYGTEGCHHKVRASGPEAAKTKVARKTDHTRNELAAVPADH